MGKAAGLECGRLPSSLKSSLLEEVWLEVVNQHLPSQVFVAVSTSGEEVRMAEFVGCLLACSPARIQLEAGLERFHLSSPAMRNFKEFKEGRKVGGDSLQKGYPHVHEFPNTTIQPRRRKHHGGETIQLLI
jgi:hypothetical protein